MDKKMGTEAETSLGELETHTEEEGEDSERWGLWG